MHRVRRCVQVSGDPCIPPGSRLQVRVRWAWVQRFPLREPRDRVAARVVRRDVRDSVMFRAV